MKKILVPLSALAMLALVACGGTSSSSSPAASSEPAQSSAQQSSSQEQVVAQISNKEALGAEWHVGEADRAVELNLTPKCNITQAIADGTIVISSSNPEVVTVLGRQLHASGEGEAKVTVTYKGVSDSVDLAVAAAIVEPDYAAPKTLSQIMALEGDDVVTPEADANHTYSKLAYPSRVKVAVIGSKVDGSNPADKYGNLYVTDPSSNEAEPAKIQVYGSGASMGALSYVFDEGYYKYVNVQNYLENEDTKAIKVGDELDVIIIRADYKTTKEISMVIRAINDKPIANDVRTTDEVNATEDSKNVRAQLVSVSGKITGWAPNKEDGTKYGNFYIQTEGSKTDPVYVYGATASSTKTVTSDEGETILDVLAMQDDGSWKFNNPQDWLTNEETKDLKVGDKITLLGFRCDYQGTLELTGIVKKYIEPAPEPDHVKASIADLIAKTASENDKLYEVSGIWEFGKGDKYGNGYLTDPATGDSIMVYGATKTATAFSYDGSSGNPVYKYTNPEDAQTTLAELHNGDKVSVLAMNAYFAGQNLPEIKCVVTAIEADSTKYTASVETPENGTVELSKSTELAYGEEVTVTATPASGYKLDSVSVIDAHGGKTQLTGETLKFKATCVNKVEASFVVDSQVVTSLNLTVDTLGQPSQAYTDKVEKTISGVAIASDYVGNYGDGLQYRVKNSKPSNIYNTSATPTAIKSITVTQSSSKDYVAADKKFLTISAGAAAIAAPVNADVVQGSDATDGVWKVEFTAEQGFTFFSVGHHTSNSGAVYIASIVVELF